MRRRRFVPMLDLPWADWLPGLVVLSVSFLLGSVAGCVLAGGVDEAENGALASYVEGYLLAAREGALEVPGLLSALWESLRWPVLAILLAFTAAGLVGIPILFGVRGFLLSYAVASFIRVLGARGSILAFLLFGFGALVSVPVLFVLGTQGFLASRNLTWRLLGEGRRRTPAYGRTYFLRCGVCAAVLVLSVCLEQTVVPLLLAALAGTF